MMGFLFGLNARLGRSHFFLATIVFAVMMTMLTFAIVMQQGSITGSRSEEPDLFLPLLIVIPVALCGTATLYSMRIRDMGSNPVVVVPVWALLVVADTVVAIYFPQLAVDDAKSGTVVGSAVNLIGTLALLFWPSSQANTSSRSTVTEVDLIPHRDISKTAVSTAPPSRFDEQTRGGSFGLLGQKLK